MKHLTLWLLKYHLKQTIKYTDKIDNSIVLKAYNQAIKSYETSIMYIESEIIANSH